MNSIISGFITSDAICAPPILSGIITLFAPAIRNFLSELSSDARLIILRFSLIDLADNTTNKLFESYQSMPMEEKEPIKEDIVLDLENKDPQTILKELASKQQTEFGACTIERLKQFDTLGDSMVKNVVVEEDNDYDLDI